MKPEIRSFLAGMVLSSALIVVFCFIVVSHRVWRMREQWEPKPVVALSADLPVGEPITLELLTQRSLPASFVTDSMVRPDDVHKLVGRPAPVSLQAGDVLLWGMFADHTTQDACFQAVVSKVNAAGDAARDGVLARFEERMGTPLPTPEPVPALTAYALGEVSVVVLKSKVPKGTVLDRSMLDVGMWPDALATASFVPAERLGDVIGARTVVELQPKDALMWQMLDDAEQPRRVASCVSEANGAIDEARARATRKETAAFVRGQETQ
ncbi:SAF domain-containing protein [Vitiosangium sp. GDMCC 1.1324]|uniref:SAF domain-containing protein n=1 Tax=Vitiosangium sp. (strain GDMCC 1.1324) TaxID=2138576 RepID=UPI000D33818E|nr:SAF domain-containing protein [Vitiosangium sp. GDMCC 1.1324]PTL83580.1 hypothetical protein DAT35_08780 [Vitiosangium sp. GDMCC 1.1324]